MQAWGEDWRLRCSQRGTALLRIEYLPTSWCWDILTHNHSGDGWIAAEAFRIFCQLRENALLVQEGSGHVCFGEYYETYEQRRPPAEVGRKYVIVRVLAIRVSERIVSVPIGSPDGEIRAQAAARGVEVSSSHQSYTEHSSWEIAAANTSVVDQFTRGLGIDTTEPAP